MTDTETEQFRTVLSKRYWLIEALSETPKTKRELDEELEYSRSTINRAVDDLLSIDCVESTQPAGRQFHITTLGTAARQLHRDYRANIERIQTNSTLLNTVPSDSIDHVFLADADMYSSPLTPDVAHQPGTELLTDATRMIGTAPVINQRYFETFKERLQAGGFELEIILEHSLVEAIEQSYADGAATLMEYDTVNAYITQKSLPYALWVIEQKDSDFAGITLYEDGGVKGTIVNDTDAATSWAKNQYTALRETASEFTRQ